VLQEKEPMTAAATIAHYMCGQSLWYESSLFGLNRTAGAYGDRNEMQFLKLPRAPAIDKMAESSDLRGL